jgi:hypothetical protein
LKEQLMRIGSKHRYVASAIAILVVAIFCFAPKKEQREKDRSLASARAVSLGNDGVLGVTSSAKGGDAAKLATSRGDMSNFSVDRPQVPASQQSSAYVLNEAGSPASLGETDSTVSTGASDVIGRPFPLSESVRRFCAGHQAGTVDCPELMEFLAKFSEEPRDEAWANSIEQRMRLLVTQSRPTDARVRQVECRTNKCVLEIEAPDEFVLNEFGSDPLLKRELNEWIGDLGFEYENGRTVVVTVCTFYRRR